MTPQLEAAIATIRPLSIAERQQLLQILTQGDFSANLPTNLKTPSQQFFQNPSSIHTASSASQQRPFGQYQGQIWMSEDFNKPLPDEFRLGEF